MIQVGVILLLRRSGYDDNFKSGNIKTKDLGLRRINISHVKLSGRVFSVVCCGTTYCGAYDKVEVLEVGC
jgi:hypothetical protein